MSDTTLNLALKKQRLQLKSAALREQWLAHAAGLQPLCAGVDRINDGVRWVREHPQAVLNTAVATGAALLVARPRTLLRLARRGFVAWQLWRKGRQWLDRQEAQPASRWPWRRARKELP